MYAILEKIGATGTRHFNAQSARGRQLDAIGRERRT